MTLRTDFLYPASPVAGASGPTGAPRYSLFHLRPPVTAHLPTYGQKFLLPPTLTIFRHPPSAHNTLNPHTLLSYTHKKMSQITDQFKGITTKGIVTWRRPIASGTVLGAIVSVWFTFVYFDYTLVTFLSRITQLLFIAGAASTFTKKTVVSAADFTACMDKAYETIRPYTQKCAQASFAILTWRDFNTSAKVFVLSFVAAYIGNYVSDTTLFLIVVSGAFSLPVVYEKKKPEIDAQITKIQQLTDKYLGMLKTKGAEAQSKVDQAKHKAEEVRDEAEAQYSNLKNQ